MAYREYIETSILDALVLFTKFSGNPYSPEALTEGLPIAENKASPKLFSLDPNASRGLFSRAAERAGLIQK